MPKTDPIDERIKSRYRRLKRAAALLPDTRIAQCSWRPAPQAAYVVGCYVPGAKRSYLANLIHCDKPHCPICAFRRAEASRHELSIALMQAEKIGYFPLLITATVRHHADDELLAMKKALAAAWNNTFGGRWYDDLKAEYQIAGKTKTWESVFGKNGWHPHIHSLMFIGLELTGRSLDEFTDRLRSRWIEQLVKLGFDAAGLPALDVRTAQSDIAAYIAKFGREPKDRTWGADSEVAMSPVKKGHFEGLTPFELLDAANGDGEALARLVQVFPALARLELVERAGWLFREHYHAFERTALIHWGKNLRPALALDEALAAYAEANPVEDDRVDMVLFDPRSDSGWKKVLALPDGRADLRAVIRTGDPFKVMAWLSEYHIDGIVSPLALEQSAADDAPRSSLPEVTHLLLAPTTAPGEDDARTLSASSNSAGAPERSRLPTATSAAHQQSLPGFDAVRRIDTS